jgi:hypothetical protein
MVEHPVDSFGNMIDIKDLQNGDYAKWLGHLTPDVIVTVLTMGGGGAAAAAGEGVAETAAEATTEQVAKTVAEDAAQTEGLTAAETATEKGGVAASEDAVVASSAGRWAETTSDRAPGMRPVEEPTPGLANELVDAPRGARGPASGRPFEPDNAGGAIRRLTYQRVRITESGIDVVERHLSRFVADGQLEAPEQAMLDRLRAILHGDLQSTPFDLRFYTHELREYVRYRSLGFATGLPSDADAAATLWNDAHTAALEDYAIHELHSPLFHPEVRP